MNAQPEGDDGPRFFSYDEANRTLPLVRRIVQDIVAEYEGRPSDAREERLEELVAELHDLGCYFKGVREALVDWYSYYAGRPVFLCWKLGEPEIGWWHQLDAGFLGRQRIEPGQRSSFRATAETRS